MPDPSPRPSLHASANRHQLLADPTRLTIIEALQEAPREVTELAGLAGVHPSTVRSHLRRLEDAGVLTSEPVPRGGRGRPAKRYRLRAPIRAHGDEHRLLVESLIRLLRVNSDGDLRLSVEAEGYELGRRMGRRLNYPTAEQTVGELATTLEQLSFSPTVRRDDGNYRIDLHNCPFRVGAGDEHGDVICSFHLGLMKGLADNAAGRAVGVRLLPLVEGGICRAEVDAT